MKQKKASAFEIEPNAIVEVTFFDPSSHSSWVERKKALLYKALKCKYVGYFLSFTKASLIVAGGIYDDDGFEGSEFHDVFVIPTGCVKKVKVVQRAPKVRRSN